MTRAACWRLALLWLGLALALAAGGARADTPVALFKSYAGNVNFVGTQETMRNKTNNQNACAVVSPTTTLSATLAGIPDSATVLSAHLYWAGSNSQAKADYNVTFEGKDVAAERRYFSRTIGSGYDYFGGAVDVTTQVQAKRNGTYTFSGLTVNSGKPYCSVQGVLGGFSLLVIYSDASEPFRVLNLYEGFQYIRYSGITLNLSNFQIPSPLPEKSTGRLGHITWEGDTTLQKYGEELLFNGTEMTDGLNPAGNQFNSKSNINNDGFSYGVDFDAYTIKPPVIKAGQTSATTRYQSGQDLVLLNAEIIAVPNEPTADLGVTIARTGELQVGLNTAYSLVVSNAGPNQDKGPVTVTVTLSAGLGYISGAGTGWTCTPLGLTITCTSDGPLNKGATMAPIALTVQPAVVGTYAVSARVAGGAFDNLQGNNRASDSAVAAPAGSVAYVLTDAECAAGVKIAKRGEQGCHRFTGPIVAGAEVPIFVTAVAGADQLPTARSTAADTTVSLRFALSCVIPYKTANVKATIKGATSLTGIGLSLCTEVGTIPDALSTLWTSIPLVFKKDAPSAPATFGYDDVGQVKLLLADANFAISSATFVVKPYTFVFAAVTRADGAPNPADKGVTGFAKAGEEFYLYVLAKTKLGHPALNFGNEGAQLDIAQVPQNSQQSQQDLPPINPGKFQLLGGGAFKGTGFSWDEAGMLELAPRVADYLNEGEVTGEYTSIGHFYPDHFTTEAASTFPCVMPKMACTSTVLETGEKVAVNGAVYSGQGFTVNITPVGMKGNQLTNYKKPFATPISLAAFDKPGPAGVANPPGVANQPAAPGKGVLTAAPTDPANGGSPVSTTARYELPGAFRSDAPRAIPAAPTAIYLRATATETVVGFPEPVVISSKLPTGTDERGVMVVHGRLQLANAFGSELIKLPVKATAQYWTGAAWENNTEDSTSDIGPAFAFSGCKGVLATAADPAPTAANCNSALLNLLPGATLRLDHGATRFWLQPPGRGNTGSAWLRMGAGNPPWLPSTRARAVFGIYKSPLIYIREVY